MIRLNLTMIKINLSVMICSFRGKSHRSYTVKDGTHECENYFERNQYVDRVLADVFSLGGKRRIVFSSFDPDICTL